MRERAWKRPRRQGDPDTGARNAALLFSAEIEAGGVSVGELLAHREVRRAARAPRVPARPVRLLEQILFKAGALSWRSKIEADVLAARTAALRGGAAAPPRFLVRVDEFPNYRAFEPDGALGTAAFGAFHEAMLDAGVPYLLAVLPFVSDEPLNPNLHERRPLADSEAAMLGSLEADGVELALHGRDHRTRFAAPRRHSELCGVSARETEALLDDALAELARHGVSPSVFVAPYNRFDAGQLPLLARRFAIVCGGPESIGTLGFQRAPLWMGETIYLPSYPPFYGTAAQILPAARAAIERQTGMWVPLTLHWEWEARDCFRSLRQLLAVIARSVTPWSALLSAASSSARVAG